MKCRLVASLGFMVAVGLVTTPLVAQVRRPARRGAPMAAARARAELRAGERVVADAPYSAVAVVERVQTLANGTKLTRKSTVTIHRDSAGRIRREQEATRVNPFGPLDREVEVPSTIFISDPVAGVAYTLYPETKTGVRRALRREEMAAATSKKHHRASRMAVESEEGARRREELGRQTIEGVEATGQRVVTTIPVGRIGNDQPIEIVEERWISTELKTLVRSRRVDPRLGENTFQLTRIDRTQPAASLFVVPEGYQITEAGKRGGPGWGSARRSRH
jgi:hypothetical protein